jgi:glutamine amidotransferase
VIVVIDCGMGNLQSVVRALRRVGADAQASSAIGEVEAADKIVLPGVGSFAAGMGHLRRNQLLPVLARRVLEERTPVLGICLGHQMLTRWSAEGGSAGLGWIDGETRRFGSDPVIAELKVPHMGWNTLDVERPSPLLEGLSTDACFYFAHSYYVTCSNRAAVAATTRYGIDFVSVLHRENIFGTQFHPEKSQANGLTLLRNFVRYS